MPGLVIPAPKRAPAASGRGAVPSIWRGVIVETYTDQTVAALIPSLYGDQAHRMPCVVAGLVKGDRCLIAAIEGRQGDWVVIAPG